MSYPQERKEAVLKKMLPPNNKTIAVIAKEESIGEGTLYAWRKKAREAGNLMPDGDTTPNGWTAVDKFTAVVETAARWILEQGKLIVASAAPFNSPSLRTLRSVGLDYVFTTMRSSEMPMKVFPQQLGVPLPNIPLYNYYPDWATNQTILPRTDQFTLT